LNGTLGNLKGAVVARTVGKGKEGRRMAGRRAWYLAVGVLVFICALCIGLGLAQGRRRGPLAPVQEVHQRHAERLLAIRGVVGTALGETPEGAPEIKVFTEAASIPDIPEELEGVPVSIEVTGEFVALAGAAPRTPARPRPGVRLTPTDRWPRPVPIGVSSGNEGEVSAGTVGCRVMAGTTVYALSNNHVYALENTAPLGSRVLQPGLYDTRGVFSAENVIGTLADYEPIDFSGGDNEIDAAIALTTTGSLSNTTPSDGYGTPRSTTADAAVGLRVQKYGRTTRLTRGSVYGTSAAVAVTYSSGTARFVNQILVKGRGFIGAGDSGSLLVTDPARVPVGLLFAGTADGSIAIANPIGPVLERFGVTIK
jgi:hypothetical protein